MSEHVLVSELDRLVSEGRNPRSLDIDVLPTLDIVRQINNEDKSVAYAVEEVLPEIARAVDIIVEAFKAGGRLIYAGAGTSGRLGVLDASECPPTFSVPEGMVIGLMAGGREAVFRAVEGAEDDVEGGRRALEEVRLTEKDVVVGIASSGRTPFVIGALIHARKMGAKTISLSCNPNSEMAPLADIAITPVVGPEILTGSTRLKSGTAQKLVLNTLTTTAMIKLGKTYGNLMVDLKASNSKLVARASRIVMQATGCTAQEAKAVLDETNYDVKVAILVQMTGMDVEAAIAALKANGGYIRQAMTPASS
ncbi:N-acetylmuramic acid 6-phosphate etherase [Rhizobium terrae]|uniref:N-acetylmuramic acid 6-phosphate etherase n=1 Tax=Rhizobium terrae TaxID=2171756 RepID=UPI000E3D2A39|nr:N-acetylmuramic acid 6-phosphate etherase [Rhizobium terrae]